MRLCPSLVKQVVWAVGIRGNVSGQAASLLLELVDALKKEVCMSLLHSRPCTKRIGCMLHQNIQYMDACPEVIWYSIVDYWYTI